MYESDFDLGPETLAEKQAAMRARNGGKQEPPVTLKTGFLTSDEQHYSVPYLAKLWALSPQTIRRLARKERDGVGKIGTNKTTFVISESAKNRIYQKLVRH